MRAGVLAKAVTSKGPEEMCLSLQHQNPSKTSEIMEGLNGVVAFTVIG